MCWFINIAFDVFNFLRPPKKTENGKKIVLKFFIQVVLTFFLMQIFNCALDEFIFMGFAKLLGIIDDNMRGAAQKNHGFRKHFFAGVKIFDNLKEYAYSIFNIFIGNLSLSYNGDKGSSNSIN